MRLKVSAAAAVAVLVALAGAAGGGLVRAATTAGAPSSNVVVIPGFHAPKYSDTHGVPAFPVGNSALSAYHFGELPLGSVTSARLQPFDTVVLYGLRWSDLSSSEQATIDDFAKTGKVVIWDADSTGSQEYASFVHPFSTTASGEVGSALGAVVTFAGTTDIASPDSSDPAYLDPNALIASTHLIGHMNVMNAGAGDWAPALIAANKRIPNGGWVLAWGYGSTGDHSGLVLYSGMDADAFTDATNPNYAIKELALGLAAPFLRSPDTSCAPNCGKPPLPSTSGGGSSGSGGGGGGTTTPSPSTSSGLGAPSSPTFAQCALTRPAPRSWVRGKVSLTLKTSIANGIHGKVVDVRGREIGGGTAPRPGSLRLTVKTRLLPSNRASKVFGWVYVNFRRACGVSATLRVDNQAPSLRVLNLAHTGGGWNLATLRASENVRVLVSVEHRVVKRFSLRGRRTVIVRLPEAVQRAALALVDRAGNRTTRSLSWR